MSDGLPRSSTAARDERWRRAFAAARRACYAGLDAYDVRASMYARLGDILQVATSSLCLTDPATGLVTHALNFGVSEAQHRFYVTTYYPHHEARQQIDMVRAGVHTTTDLAPTDVGEAFRSVLVAQGLGEGVRLALHAGGKLWGSWGMMREHGTPAFDDVERRWLARLAPHLTHAIRRATLAADASHANASARDDAFDDAPAVLTFDDLGRLVFQTTNAAAVLRDLADQDRSAGLVVRGVVAHSVPTVIGGVLAQLRWRHRHAAEHPDIALAGVLTARGASGRLYTLHASLSEPSANGSALTIVSVTPARTVTASNAIAVRYGLSPREQDVLLRVARGESTKTIAAALGLSPYTIQEYVGRACERVGVTTRKELVAKLFLDARRG